MEKDPSKQIATELSHSLQYLPKLKTVFLEANIPHTNQSATIFATQEIVVNYLRDGKKSVHVPLRPTKGI